MIAIHLDQYPGEVKLTVGSPCGSTGIRQDRDKRMKTHAMSSQENPANSSQQNVRKMFGSGHLSSRICHGWIPTWHQEPVDSD